MPCTVTRVHVNVTLDFVDFALNNCITLHHGNKLQQGGLQLLKQHANQILKKHYVCGECYLRQSSCHVLQAHLAGRF